MPPPPGTNCRAQGLLYSVQSVRPSSQEGRLWTPSGKKLGLIHVPFPHGRVSLKVVTSPPCQPIRRWSHFQFSRIWAGLWFAVTSGGWWKWHDATPGPRPTEDGQHPLSLLDTSCYLRRFGYPVGERGTGKEWSPGRWKGERLSQPPSCSSLCS